MKRVEFVYFDAGGGHRSAANALKSCGRAAGPPLGRPVCSISRKNWTRSISSGRLHDFAMQDFTTACSRKAGRSVRNICCRRCTGSFVLFHPAQVECSRDLGRERPDMVVSVVPNFNRACFKRTRARPGTPFVTILTDFADYPPHFWLERQDHYVICGTERAYRASARFGQITGKDVPRISG